MKTQRPKALGFFIKNMENEKDINSGLFVDQEALKKEYLKYNDARYLIVNEIKERIEQVVVALGSNPVVSGRIKNFNSFFNKYLRLLKLESKEPKINDLLGIRIICPFIEDLNAAENILRQNFEIMETERKGHYTFKEFGYESTHFLIKIPQSIIDEHGDPGTDIAEIQIRTILQDAWAEVEHEVVYKAEYSPFDEPMKRKLAAVNASLSLADIIFQEIRSYQRKYSREMGKRRESFLQKIEESTDDFLFSQELPYETASSDINLDDVSTVSDYNNVTIDDLLVSALTAHNQNRFDEAINQYTKILELNPNDIIASIIYKHRGMACFACSRYNEAIDNFNRSLELDDKSYKAAYYRGVVKAVLKQYSKAIDDYSLSLKINPYQSFCIFRRAQAYYHIGDFPQALADCENSLALEPGNESASKFREMLRDKLKM